jgi:hypothetical protein
MKSIVPARIQKVFMLSTLFSLYYYYFSFVHRLEYGGRSLYLNRARLAGDAEGATS